MRALEPDYASEFFWFVKKIDILSIWVDGGDVQITLQEWFETFLWTFEYFL